MSYFAKIDNDNIVEQVIVADQSFIDDQPGVWVETDYSGISPKNYAGIGYSWDEERNAFIQPQSYDSWSLNEDSCRWEAPTPRPNDGKQYDWDEDSLSWIEWTLE